jgi:hypothetical protein
MMLSLRSLRSFAAITFSVEALPPCASCRLFAAIALVIT